MSPAPNSRLIVDELTLSLKDTESSPKPVSIFKFSSEILAKGFPKTSSITASVITVLNTRLSSSVALEMLIFVAAMVPLTSISTPSRSALSASRAIIKS